MSDVSFYYDFSCPWSYLALVRLRDAADRNGMPISLRPVNVDAVLATENPDRQKNRWADNPAKAAWQRTDLDHWARFWGLTINLSADWPQPGARAAAAAAAAIQLDAGFEFSLHLFAAHFGTGVNITDAAVLNDVAAQCGLEADAFETALTTATAQVESWTDELIRRGGFGTPSVFVGDQLFFGNDRIPLVDWVIGPISNHDFVMPGQHS
jgi:2-hydroxychromene-2-carboxylate isomerase